MGLDCISDVIGGPTMAGACGRPEGAQAIATLRGLWALRKMAIVVWA